MKTTMKWGAMYACLESGDTVAPIVVQLGDQFLMPGDKISRIGKKKRSMFAMQDGFSLVYKGICGSHLIFTSHPTGCDGDPWYYAFAYVSHDTLLIGGGKGCADIKVNDLVLITA
jgi:hypothetical protein